MATGLRFGVGPLRISIPLTGARGRRRRSASRTRTTAPRGTVAEPAFHGTVPLPDGSTYICPHIHGTEQSATACAEKYIRANFSQARSPTGQKGAASPPWSDAADPGTAGSPPWSDAAPPVANSPQGAPRASWGTVRKYRAQNAGNGRVSLSFTFVPDDGSEPRLFELADVAPLEDIGEYARGVVQGDNFTVKISAKTMAETRQTFQEINWLSLPERKKMFAMDYDLSGDAGWAWTPDYTLMPVVPGLLN